MSPSQISDKGTWFDLNQARILWMGWGGGWLDKGSVDPPVKTPLKPGLLVRAARPSFLANIPQPKSINTEEHERESIDRTDGDSAPPSWGGVLNPEVQDMLHGPVVNDTYLHKVDSDDVTETKDTNFPHNNSTDVVDSPHVEDPGSTHLEEEINDSGNITAGSSANTEDSTNNTSYKSQDVNPPTNDTVVAGQEAQSAASPSQSQSNIVGPIVAELNTTGSGNITASPSTNLSSSDAEVVNANTSAVEHSEAEDSNTANSGVDSEATFNKTRNHPTFLQPSESAGILAGVFVGLALLGYVGLLVWRRILEKRYGNREMLVNEDDFYDTSDLKHFEQNCALVHFMLTVLDFLTKRQLLTTVNWTWVSNITFTIIMASTKSRLDHTGDTTR
uniref:Uncharacterized protein n=1 Tax=Timema bartmani TaxID=61472 RepID=A0A7R9F4S7_9NEOP|nr:unnamed protein product [Timema bartmani]